MNYSPSPIIFNRMKHRKNRDRAARHFEDYSFLKMRAIEDVGERLLSVNRVFDLCLDMGAHNGDFARYIGKNPELSERIGKIISCDISERMICQNVLSDGVSRLVCDEEILPFAPAQFDLVTSLLSAHWVNDLPGLLVQIRQILKPDGLMILGIIGEGSLIELRQSFIAAESAYRGGAAHRIIPFCDVQTLAGLLQRTGFAMPVTDTDLVQVRYETLNDLLGDLRGMGEQDALYRDRPIPLMNRAILAEAERQYRHHFADMDGRLPASFNLLWATGWAPHPDQPKPKAPGSANVRLADALGVREVSTGEKAGR